MPCFQPQRPWPGCCLESGILETGHLSCSPMGQDDGAEKANDRIYFLWKKKKKVGQKPCVFSYVLQLTFRNKLQAPGIGLPCMILWGDDGRGGGDSGPHSSSLNCYLQPKEVTVLNQTSLPPVLPLGTSHSQVPWDTSVGIYPFGFHSCLLGHGGAPGRQRQMPKLSLVYSSRPSRLIQ